MADEKQKSHEFEGRLVEALAAENVQLTERLKSAERFAKTGLRSATISAVAAGLVLVIGVIFFPRVKHIAVDNTEAVCPIEATAQSMVSSGLITEFAKECVLDLDGWGFDDYERRLKQATDRCMTMSYRKAYLTNPTINSRISTVREGVLRVKPTAIDVPAISEQGKSADGADSWTVQIPIRRAYFQGEKTLRPQEVVYNVTVVRVPRQAYMPLGLAIENLVEKPYISR